MIYKTVGLCYIGRYIQINRCCEYKTNKLLAFFYLRLYNHFDYIMN